MTDFRVVYLTGAPAAGKTTLVEGLKRAVTPLTRVNFGEMLGRYLSQRAGREVTQEEVRANRAGLASAADIVAVDRLMLDEVASLRQRSHVVIDTHAVTREEYGFRITPYSATDFARLAPTSIVVLYVEPEVTLRRIGESAAGRGGVTAFGAGFHAGLQGAVASAYAIAIGRPVFFVDGSRPASEVVLDITRLAFGLG